MNRATISPPIPALYRINCGELVDRNAVTNVEKLSMSGKLELSENCLH